jgi:malonate-semialdehyde dehydrogenase (acetylating) / methylmalonate-semialdehyde dehydrogenase
MTVPTITNYIGGAWTAPKIDLALEVLNPANQEVLARVQLSSAADVAVAVQSAESALPDWRATPPGERVQYLFRMKTLLETHREELARSITMECGKTLEESRGELQRAIENIEVACGIPSLLQGKISEDIAPGIDEMMLRQPVGVCAGITPFNFPAMIPFWFLPYALACGNPFILKPSERVPMTMQRVFQLFEDLALPPGVLNLVQGGKDAVDALLQNPVVQAVSFVGSTLVARHIYSEASANGKRAQCQGGAKNPIVIMPDADMEMAARIVADSAFGCAGQRCLAASVAITVGSAREAFHAALLTLARERVVGFGLEAGVQMGPVITATSKTRIEALIEKGIASGARALLDGRKVSVPGYERGNFLSPTILVDLPTDSELANTEIFGPVLTLMHVQSIEDAIEYIHCGRYGNMACLFTESGPAARKFRNEVEAGNVGINIGVAAPIAYFPFSGWKDSFFGDLHAQGTDGVDFFTRKKVVIERWPKEWSRKF